VLRVVPGPRDDWFTASALQTLCAEPWRVSSSSNRVGIRLEGPPLERARHDELLSEGLVTGALQVPASGRPILLMHDHPTTGGYPVIAVVRSDDLWLAGQLAPRQCVRFAVDG
jgi:allophanate hydrolase subunit 2